MTAAMTELELRITKLERAPAGHWRARVSAGGRTYCVDRRYGSWQAEVRTAPGARTFVRKEVLPPVAAELQARVRPIEKRERRAADAATAPADNANEGTAAP